MSNITQHAQADHATVRINENHWLEIDISDNGIGIPEINSPGVGISSMKERAAELGGICSIKQLPTGGTLVSARLPLQMAYHADHKGV